MADNSVAPSPPEGTPQKPNSPAQNEAVFSVRGRLVVALLVVVLLIAGGGGWMATAKLSGAVIAPGSIVVERHVKKVQHLDGGIVAEIRVNDGEVVEAGDILIKLDDTPYRAEMGVVQSQIIELTGRLARLTAERDEQSAIEFPVDFDAMGSDTLRVRNGEIRLFNSNQEALKTTKDQLRLRIGQAEEEIRALTSQRDAKANELRLIRRELGQVRTLWQQKLTSVARLYELEREVTQVAGDHGGLEAQIARALGQINEINIEILAVDQAMRRDAQREIRDIEAKVAELSQRKIAIVDRLSRVEIRAPVSGVVHELAVHTVGGVVTPANDVMLIVPRNDDLTIEARILPHDIDQIGPAQPVRIRLSAFNQRATSELQGQVVQVAADVTEDNRTGQAFYMTRIEIDPASMETISDWKLVPGMPVEVFITTGERTALSYLGKPITDQLARSFRDD